MCADIAQEAIRQLDICNACRYCEGYCAVFPSLERRTRLSSEDVLQLSNLCHDCGACLEACMYAPPHEFAIDLPTILSTARRESYKELRGWPLKRWSRWTMAGTLFLSAILVVVVALATRGSAPFSGSYHATSPYSVLTYPALLVLILVPALWACVLLGLSARRYWQTVGAPKVGSIPLHAWHSALKDAATLRNLQGGGAGCSYPKEDEPNPLRRLSHLTLEFGFLLCLVSTISAGILQDVAGTSPFYRVLSVPVICGIIGGIGLVVGSSGLLMLKLRTGAFGVVFRDSGFILGMLLLGVTGLLTLFTRDSSVFSYVFAVHLVVVVWTFILAPATKFPHFIYRVMALVVDATEQAG